MFLLILVGPQLVVQSLGFPSKVSFVPFKASVVCKYCKKPDHSIDMCYKLHILPPNFKPNMALGRKRSVTHVELGSFGISGAPSMPVGSVEQSESESSSTAPGLTKDQYS